MSLNTNTWFTFYVKNAIVTFNDLKFTRTFIESEMKTVPSKEKKILKKDCAELYYQQLRLIAELFYIIEQYYDIVLENVTPENENAFKRLTNAIYKKINDFPREISIHTYEPTTLEKKGIVKSALQQLCSTEKMVKKYISKEDLYYRPQRNVKPVNYKV